MLKLAWVITLLVIISGSVGGYYFWQKSSDKSSSPDSSQTQEKDANDNSAKIKFDKVKTITVDGASLWLFAIVDDKNQVILSTEGNGGIKLAKFDLNNPNNKPEWKTVINSSDIEGKRVADHWHEFYNDYHWIVFSISEANTGYLLKLDRELNRIKLAKVADKTILKEGEVPMINSMNPYLPTNDMFLVPEDKGVTAGFYLPGTGHKLFRLDSDLNLLENINIGGGDYTHGNGSSAKKVENGYDLIAVDQMNMLQQGAVNLIKFDADWNPIKKISLVDIDKTNIGMASGVYTDNGTLIVNARVYESAYPKGELPPPADPNAPLAQDGAKIKRFTFDSNYKLLSTEEIYNQTDGNRPHTSIIDDKLITAWDAGGKAYLRIDKISY